MDLHFVPFSECLPVPPFYEGSFEWRAHGYVDAKGLKEMSRGTQIGSNNAEKVQ